MVLAEALSLAHHCVLGPHHAALRLALADELIAVSPATGRPLDGLMGLAWRTVDLFLAGDRRAPRALAELRERLERRPLRRAALPRRRDRRDVGDPRRTAGRGGTSSPASATSSAWMSATPTRSGGTARSSSRSGGCRAAGASCCPGRATSSSSHHDRRAGAGFVAAVAALAATGRRSPRGAGGAGVSARGRPAHRGVIEHLVGDDARRVRGGPRLDDADAAAEAYELLVPFADLADHGQPWRGLLRIGAPAARTGRVDDG